VIGDGEGEVNAVEGEGVQNRTPFILVRWWPEGCGVTIFSPKEVRWLSDRFG
jgi:hypothetical protein